MTSAQSSSLPTQALAASWRQRSFEPCRDLCTALVPAARSYAERYHTGSSEPLLCQVAAGLPFDRAYWRSLAGEVLLFAALHIQYAVSFATLEVFVLGLGLGWLRVRSGSTLTGMVTHAGYDIAVGFLSFLAK